MSRYPPTHELWHDDLALIQPCNCDDAYASRGLVDSRCWYHDTIETIETLREYNWIISFEDEQL